MKKLISYTEEEQARAFGVPEELIDRVYRIYLDSRSEEDWWVRAFDSWLDMLGLDCVMDMFSKD